MAPSRIQLLTVLGETPQAEATSVLVRYRGPARSCISRLSGFSGFKARLQQAPVASKALD
jgi:hypothetical protein